MNLPSLTVILTAIRISFCDYTADKRGGPWNYLRWTQEWFDCCAKDNCTSYRGKDSDPEGKGFNGCFKWTDKMKQKYPDAGLESNYCRNPGGSKLAPWCFVYVSPGSKEPNWRYCPVCTKDYGKFGNERTYEDTDGSSANMFGSESDLTIEYSASSKWSSSYDAGHAAEGEGAYWCSDGGDEAPLYWWISFKEKPVEIVTITFEEKYPGAVFEFFGSSTEECAEKGTVLINGTRADIFDRKFSNGRSYHCYGLKITKLAKSSHGRLASLMKFDFQYTGTKNCYYASDQGRGFRGKLNVTLNGRTCQQWSSQSPHRHSYTPGSDIGRKYQIEENYCRNPSGGKGPWCYTTDNEKRWEYCLPKCQDCLKRGQLCSLGTGLENGGCCPVHHTRGDFQRYGQFYHTDFRNMTCKLNKQEGRMRCETDCVEKDEIVPAVQQFKPYCCWGLDRRYTYERCLLE